MTSTKAGPSNVLNGLSRARKGIGIGGRSEHSPRPPRRFSSRAITLTLLVIPSVVLVILIYGYPAIYSVYQSLHNGTLVDAGPYVGLHNYWIDLHNPIFWGAVRFTVLFCVVGVFGSWAVGLGLGQLLFLDSPGLAKFIVCLYKIWLSYPFMMLMASAALAGVEPQLYEAAQVDGAGGWQQFRRITLPMIARSTYISWILMFIFCIGAFQSIYLLTGGGPVSSTNTLVVLAYLTVFGDFQTGPGVAIGIIMTALSVLVAVVLYRQIRKVQIL